MIDNTENRRHRQETMKTGKEETEKKTRTKLGIGQLVYMTRVK